MFFRMPSAKQCNAAAACFSTSHLTFSHPSLFSPHLPLLLTFHSSLLTFPSSFTFHASSLPPLPLSLFHGESVVVGQRYNVVAGVVQYQLGVVCTGSSTNSTTGKAD